MRLLLDTGILDRLVHPKRSQNRPATRWMERLLDEFGEKVQVFLAEIADYELRRKLLHLLARKQTSSRSIDPLNDLAILLDYLPLETTTMHRAAQLWADARSVGTPTAADAALDGDVILAAQAIEMGGTIVTTNRKHPERFTLYQDWTEVESDMAMW